MIAHDAREGLKHPRSKNEALPGWGERSSPRHGRGFSRRLIADAR
jgi:hypothetical protein